MLVVDGMEGVAALGVAIQRPLRVSTTLFVLHIRYALPGTDPDHVDPRSAGDAGDNFLSDCSMCISKHWR